MLERLSHNFRLLLNAFQGGTCPLCAVRASLVAREINRLRAKDLSPAVLCGEHLAMRLAGIDAFASRARLTRATIEAAIDGRFPCDLCQRRAGVERRLGRSIRALDHQMRFHKALEMAPLFCQRHATAILAGGPSPTFAQVQRTKLHRLRNGLAQAELRNSEDLERLITAALALLGRPLPPEPVRAAPESADTANEDDTEFGRWDDELHLRRLSDLESEVAKLRYRNAILSEENRGLKLAHVAAESIRRDLERDRAELLAEKNQSKPNGGLT